MSMNWDVTRFKYFENYGMKFGPDNVYGNFIHTFRDLGLLPRTKPVIEPPKPKLMTVEIPGANGVLDYTEALTGSVQYENRAGHFEYVYVNDRKYFDGCYHRVLRAVHGKKLRVILDEDPTGYYEGRLMVQEPSYENGLMVIPIDGDFYPYRFDLYTTTEPWRWDPFNFHTGVIRNYKNISINSPSAWMDYTIIGSDMPVTPDVILVSGSVKLIYPKPSGGTGGIDLQPDSNLLLTPDFIIGPGEHTLQFKGSGVVSIDYKTGSL